MNPSKLLGGTVLLAAMGGAFYAASLVEQVPLPPLDGYEQLVVDECEERGQDWRAVIDRAGDGKVLGIRCYSPTRGYR